MHPSSLSLTPLCVCVSVHVCTHAHTLSTGSWEASRDPGSSPSSGTWTNLFTSVDLSIPSPVQWGCPVTPSFQVKNRPPSKYEWRPLASTLFPQASKWYSQPGRQAVVRRVGSQAWHPSGRVAPKPIHFRTRGLFSPSSFPHHTYVLTTI